MTGISRSGTAAPYPGMISSSRPTLTMMSMALWISSSVWVAMRLNRIRALPLSTAGEMMGLT